MYVLRTMDSKYRRPRLTESDREWTRRRKVGDGSLGFLTHLGRALMAGKFRICAETKTCCVRQFGSWYDDYLSASLKSERLEKPGRAVSDFTRMIVGIQGSICNNRRHKRRTIEICSHGYIPKPGLLPPWETKCRCSSTRNGLRQRTQRRCGCRVNLIH